jgi:hypothetical protein
LAFDSHSQDTYTWDYTNWNPRSYVPDPFTFAQTQTPNTLGPNMDVLYDCPDSAKAQLDGMPCTVFDSAQYISCAPRSTHPGGVFATTMDGAVKYLIDEADPKNMALMIAIDDATTFDASRVTR